LKHLLPAIDALPSHVDFREILVDTTSQTAAVPPDTVPKPPITPGPARTSEPREKLKIMADELRKQQPFSKVQPMLSATRQKSKKPKTPKEQKRALPRKRRRRSKKGKAH
jgi:hypothetical protein